MINRSYPCTKVSFLQGARAPPRDGRGLINMEHARRLVRT